MIDVDVGLEQARDDPRVAALGGPDQAGPVVAVLGIDVGAGAERELEEAWIVTHLAGRDQVRALLGVVLGVDVGTVGDEAACGRDVVLVRGVEQLAVDRA